jgi:serine/threonine protein kinase
MHPGDLFADRYEIKRPLGEGHRKVVYLAEDQKMHRNVALALLKDEALRADPEGADQETRILGAIGGHENIVRLYEMDAHGPVRYMVFEYLAGGTLSAYITTTRELGGSIPVDEVLRLGRQICRALSHLHQKGIIHRDLSPNNVWLDERRGAHLGDFDTAIFMDSPPLILRALTNEGYGSPEERLGQPLDERSDLYSFGAVLYSIALGEERAVRDVAHLRKARPEMPRSFGELVASLLDDSPENRPSDAETTLKRLAEIERANDLEDFLQMAADPPGNEPPELSVRELLGYWGAVRRDHSVLQTIHRALEDRGLTTEPPFADLLIDDVVRVVRIASVNSQDQPSVAPKVPQGASLRVRHIRSANGHVASVPHDASLSLAQAVMLRYDYSQLAVVSGPRTIRGAVSWKSIAQAQMRDQASALKDALIPAELVNLDDDLLPLIPTIVHKEFVFVRRPDFSLGIITMADLSLEYNDLARPFLLIGEIERRLRRAISEAFDKETMKAARDPNDVSREVDSAANLTFGEYRTLLARADNWQKLHWNTDRAYFIKTLDELRTIRNDVMHFSPDPIDEEQLNLLHNFVRWLKVLDPRG